jgi:hypothetical protein
VDDIKRDACIAIDAKAKSNPKSVVNSARSRVMRIIIRWSRESSSAAWRFRTFSFFCHVNYLDRRLSATSKVSKVSSFQIATSRDSLLAGDRSFNVPERRFAS